VLEPDRQGQDTLRLRCRPVPRPGSASATVRAFRRPHVPCPRRGRRGPPHGALVGGARQPQDVRRLRQQPCEAGAVGLGRTRPAKPGAGTSRLTSLPREPWPVVGRAAHVGSLSGEAPARPLSPVAAKRQA
jgi:hypothetical protein